MSSPTPQPTAAVIIIGNEILSGRTQDVNLNTIAKKLSEIGVKLAEARVVPDVEAEIIAAVNALRARYTYVFTTGGIGPTHDDITSATIAKAFGVPLIEHPDARARLLGFYTPAKLNEARLSMAYVPEGAELIDNPISAAPGYRIENVFVLAGVPTVMQAMMNAVAADLQHGPAISSVTISCALGEGTLARDLAAIAARYPALEIGSYPSFRHNRIGVSLVVRGTDGAAVQAAAEEIKAIVVNHDGKPEVETTV